MKNPILEWFPSSQPGALIYRAQRLYVRVGEPRLAALGFAIGQFPVLAALRKDGPLSQKELTARANIEQPTMAQTLARMERDGLIERRPNPTDKRSSLISLSPEALDKSPMVMEALMQGNRDALQGFTESETETLVNLLKRVIENLENTLEKREENE
ncbi:MarR family transcriptional regulator [bacterium]|nr:MAG: MarR family transcriptional regulator [bacterium]